MTDLNNEKLKKISETLQSTIDDGKTKTFDKCPKPFKYAEVETTKPMSITGYVDFIRDALAHFPTHIQIRILARAAMQIADEQHKDINRLARGK